MFKRILVVGPDINTRKLISEYLGGIYDIAEVEDCKEALRYLKRRYSLVKVVLVEASCLQQNKYELLSHMKKNIMLGQIPVICIGEAVKSENEQEMAEREALEHGAIDFFAPPYNIDILIYRIQNLITFRDNAVLTSLSSKGNAMYGCEEDIAMGALWNEKSMDTMIMRTYVGAACFFEYTNAEFTLLRVNDKFIQELIGRGYSKETVLALDMVKYLDDNGRETFRKTVEKAIRTEGEECCELLLYKLRYNQSIMHVCVKMKQIDHLKERHIFYCTMENDTERFLAQGRERALTEQLQTIIQNVNGGVTAAYIHQNQIYFIYSNDEFYSIFGYTRKTFTKELPNAIYDLILPEYHETVQNSLITAAQNLQTAQLEYEAKKRDGSHIWIRTRNSVCYMNEIKEPVYITVYMDITKEKQAEERIQAINERLGNSEIYIHMDITNRNIKEYRSIYESQEQTDERMKQDMGYEEIILSSIYEEDKESVKKSISFDHLYREYEIGNTKLDVEYRRCMPNGEIRWFCAVAILMEGIEKGTVHAFIYCHDIDTRKKNRLARYQIVDEYIDMVLLINVATGQARGVKIYNGSMIAKGEKHDYTEMIERFISIYVAEEDKLRCQDLFSLSQMIETVEQQEMLVFSFWLISFSGSNKRKSTNVTFLDNTHKDLLMVGRDITTLFEKEEGQRLLLQQAVEEANDANRAKSEFLSRMSHDMRTPLNTVLGLTEVMKRENNNPEMDDYLKSIDNSGQYLLGLINDTLDLSKIESGKMDLFEEQYPIEDFILGLETVIQPLMDAKHIEFIMDLDRKAENIVVDKLRFNQIFYNLLSNAAKYTQEGGRVEIHSESISPKDDKFGMRFIIRDNGMGMSQEYIKVMFDPFTQEKNIKKKEQKGSGLGLAIVKKIVDLTKGTIQVKSELGKGTEFVLELYAYSVQHPPKVKERRIGCDKSVLKDKRILVVDDNEINVMILIKLLEYQECIVESAENGLEALNLFEKSEAFYYDLILTDIRMPVMDGLEEARKIRAMDRSDANKIPIIAATADVYTEEQDQTVLAGINARLVKPIKTEELYETIIQLLKKKN